MLPAVCTRWYNAVVAPFVCAYENGNCRCTSGWTVYYGRRYDTGGRPGRGGQLPLGEVLLLEHKERVSSGASLRCSNSQFGGDPQALWYKVRALVDSLAPDNNISDRVQRRQPVAWLIDERLATSASAEQIKADSTILYQYLYHSCARIDSLVLAKSVNGQRQQ